MIEKIVDTVTNILWLLSFVLGVIAKMGLMLVGYFVAIALLKITLTLAFGVDFAELYVLITHLSVLVLLFSNFMLTFYAKLEAKHQQSDIG